MSQRIFPAHQLSVGDIVSPDVRGSVSVIGKVTAIAPDEVTVDGHAIETDGVEFVIHRFADGIPNTAAIAWFDPDRREHIALQNGHPLNRSWLYNGKAVGSAAILAVAGTMPIGGLDWVDVP